MISGPSILIVIIATLIIVVFVFIMHKFLKNAK